MSDDAHSLQPKEGNSATTTLSGAHEGTVVAANEPKEISSNGVSSVDEEKAFREDEIIYVRIFFPPFSHWISKQPLTIYIYIGWICRGRWTKSN